MGWLSYYEATKARSEVYDLEVRVMALENKVQVLENELRSLKTK